MSSLALQEKDQDLKFEYYNEKQDKRIIPNKKSRPKINLRRIFALIIVFLAIILIFQIAFHLLIAPRLSLKNIEIVVENGFSLTNSDILRIAGLENMEYYFSLNIESVKNRLESNPLIKSAAVERVFPDTLKINVLKRKPVALSIVEKDGVSVPVYFDEEGVVFFVGSTSRGYNVPFVSGLVFTDLKPGIRLQRELVSFLKDLKTLKDSSPVLFEQISEVKFVKKSDVDYEVLLYLVNYKVRVRIGSSINEKLLTYIILALDVVSSQSIIGELEEVDFRTGDIVYRIKEE